MNKRRQWGYLREDAEDAKKAAVDKLTGLHRTSLLDYLKVIFPGISENEWIHDKTTGLMWNGKKLCTKPDYRCVHDGMHLIVEFDGVQHYERPDVISKDLRTTEIYEQLGFRVVRIPYFIQLTNRAVKTLFGIKVNEKLFDVKYASLGAAGRGSPASICPAGFMRMALEFLRHREQYKVNLNALRNANDEFMTSVSNFERMYEYCRKRYGNGFPKSSTLLRTVVAESPNIVMRVIKTHL